MHGLIPDINLVILQVALEHIAEGFFLADTNWDFKHAESTKMQAAILVTHNAINLSFSFRKDYYGESTKVK